MRKPDLAASVWCRLILFILLPHVPCLAQTGSDLTNTPPDKAYYALKRVLQTFYNDGELRSKIASATTYDVISCQTGAELLGDKVPQASPLYGLADLASNVVVWRSDLRKLGYPEQVWRPMLIVFEDAQLKLLLSEGPPTGDWTARPSAKNREKFEQQLADALNDYRNRNNPQLPEAIREGGCGAGGISVKIQIIPADGELFFVPKLLYRYCAALGANADDLRACSYWNRVSNGISYEVSGTYQYVARWPDGSVKQGSLDFSKYEDQATVSFSKQ